MCIFFWHQCTEFEWNFEDGDKNRFKNIANSYMILRHRWFSLRLLLFAKNIQLNIFIDITNYWRHIRTSEALRMTRSLWSNWKNVIGYKMFFIKNLCHLITNEPKTIYHKITYFFFRIYRHAFRFCGFFVVVQWSYW